jgi:hypothetical protein
MISLSWTGLTRPSTTFFKAKTWMPGMKLGITKDIASDYPR